MRINTTLYLDPDDVPGAALHRYPSGQVIATLSLGAGGDDVYLSKLGDRAPAYLRALAQVVTRLADALDAGDVRAVALEQAVSEWFRPDPEPTDG